MTTLGEHAAALEAGFLLATFSAWVRWAPASATSRLLERLEPGTEQAEGGDQIEGDGARQARHVELALARASRSLRGHTCLARALTAFVMLRRRHQPVRLRLGARRSEGGQLSIHAWVETADGSQLGAHEEGPFSVFRERR